MRTLSVHKTPETFEYSYILIAILMSMNTEDAFRNGEVMSG